jgi:predicted transcriptional regulator
MIKIELMREIKRKDLIIEYGQKYGSMQKLQKMIEKDPYNVILEVDLDEWEYSKTHGEEILKQTRIIYTTQGLPAGDLEILDKIKNEAPESITELANMMNKDVSHIQRKVNRLKKEGFVELAEGNINNVKTPYFNYDKIEIAI